MALTDPERPYSPPTGNPPTGNPVHDLLQKLAHAHDRLEEAQRAENDANMHADEARMRKLEAVKHFTMIADETKAMINMTLGHDRPVPSGLGPNGMLRSEGYGQVH